MFCSKCGKENPDGSKVCMACGNPFPQMNPVLPQQTAPQSYQQESGANIPQGYGVGAGQNYVNAGANAQAQVNSSQSLEQALGGLGQAVNGVAQSVSGNMKKMGAVKFGPFVIDFSDTGLIIGLLGGFLFFLSFVLPYVTVSGWGEKESMLLIRDFTVMGIFTLLIGLGSMALVAMQNKILHAIAAILAFILFLVTFIIVAVSIEASGIKDWGFKASWSIGWVFMLLGTIALIAGCVLRFIKGGTANSTKPGAYQQQSYGNPYNGQGNG